ncbi:uncharacterized protein LOC128032534 [Gossypium raimondii]|uniref:uncharacterized protein LOC128032534 n=1 Tax=Gossypium raimondii TaxID=29730 RepID=UPI00227C35B5|nr:uncharacterized protein LOC128032534 [Gossypium raimondii]
MEGKDISEDMTEEISASVVPMAEEEGSGKKRAALNPKRWRNLEEKEIEVVFYYCCNVSFTPPPPPVFAGENYHIWVVKIRTYLREHNLWKVVENDTELAPLRVNPTIAQIKQHSEECAKNHKAMSCLQNGVSDVIFTRIMACDTLNQAWEKLKEEFLGSDKTKQQQLINLRRDFENLKMRESETIK